MYLLKGSLFSTQINTAPSDQSILFKKKQKKKLYHCWKIMDAQVTRVSTVLNDHLQPLAFPSNQKKPKVLLSDSYRDLQIIYFKFCWVFLL